MEPLCTCGRRRLYKDCCKALHYLPLTQFTAPSQLKAPLLEPTCKVTKPLPSAITDNLTWPRATVYLHGKSDTAADLQDDSESLYKSSLSLKRPGFSSHSDRVFNLDPNDGTSHFRIRDGAGQVRQTNTFDLTTDQDPLPLQGALNKEGFLSSLSYGPFTATSFFHAEVVASIKFAKAMSLLSLRFDSPLEGRLLMLEHISSRKISTLQMVPDWEVVLPGRIHIVGSPYLKLCSSFYREGLNNSSVLYSFLCFFKVITAIRYARTREFPGINFAKDFRERLPSSESDALPWIKSLFFVDNVAWSDNYIRHFLPRGAKWGMAFGDVEIRVLRPKRNEIAHALERDAASTIDPDDPQLTHEIRLMLPLIKLIARSLIKNTYPELLSSANNARSPSL